MLGAKEAFPKAADMYRHDGDEDSATFYYAMAAACDDTSATVAMAKRTMLKLIKYAAYFP